MPYNLLICLFIDYCRLVPECKLHEGGDLCLLFPLVITIHLGQCTGRCRWSNKYFSVNQLMDDLVNLCKYYLHCFQLEEGTMKDRVRIMVGKNTLGRLNIRHMWDNVRLSMQSLDHLRVVYGLTWHHLCELT